MATEEKPFQVGGAQFTALRKHAPIPHWVLRLDETGEVLLPGAGGFSTKSVPKMQASVQDYLDWVCKGDIARFRQGLGLPPQSQS